MSTDNSGVEYEDNYGILVRAPDGLGNYIILASCYKIKGGSSASDSPFYRCTKCNQISFQENSLLETIENYAFAEFKSLQSIDFSNCNKLKNIPKYCFSKCPLLNSVILPNNIESFSDYCFQSTNQLTYLKCPDFIKTLGYHMFHDSKIKKFEISESNTIESIGNEIFAFSAIQMIYIPKYVESIDGSAFMSCYYLNEINIHPDNTNFHVINKTMILDPYEKALIYSIIHGNLTIPSTVKILKRASLRGTYITSITFEASSMEKFNEWCLSTTTLTSFTFPKGITKIPIDGLSYNSKLKEVILTEDIVTIETNAFQSCLSLETIDLKNVQEIGEKAFRNCVELGTVVFPESLTTLGKAVFSSCPKLNVNSSQNNHFYIVDGMLFTTSSSQANIKDYLSEFFGSQTTVVLPSFCRVIGEEVFSTKNISTVLFNQTCMSDDIEIKKKAFSYSAISTIELPPTLTKIEDEAFSNCNSLTSIIFTDNIITTIPTKCFYNCSSLSNIILPDSLNSIGNEAFSICPTLASIDFSKISNLHSIGDAAFNGTNIQTISLPSSVNYIGKSAFMNSNIQSIQYNDCIILNISVSCFENAKLLEDVELSDFVKIIDERAFYGCESLEQIVLPHHIEVLQYSCFQYCKSLKTVTLAQDCNLNTVKGYAFGNCPLLHEITLHNNDTTFTFKDGALLYKNLTKLLFFLPSSNLSIFFVPANVETINDYAFQGCKNLKTIIITYGNIHEIGFSAFAECTKLTTIYLPKGINSIKQSVFDGCTSLKCGSIITFPEVINVLLDQNPNIDPKFYSSDCPIIRITQCECRGLLTQNLAMIFIFIGHI